MIALVVGQTVAYSAKFLRSIGDYSRDGAERRGVYLGTDPAWPDMVRVRWSDTEPVSGYGADYDAEIAAKGSLVRKGVVCAIRSAAFGDAYASESNAVKVPR